MVRRLAAVALFAALAAAPAAANEPGKVAYLPVLCLSEKPLRAASEAMETGDREQQRTVLMGAYRNGTCLALRHPTRVRLVEHVRTFDTPKSGPREMWQVELVTGATAFGLIPVAEDGGRDL